MSVSPPPHTHNTRPAQYLSRGNLGRIYSTDCADCGPVAAVAAERGRGPGQSYSSDPTLHWARLLICATRPGQAVITAGRCRTTNELILNELRNTGHRSPHASLLVPQITDVFRFQYRRYQMVIPCIACARLQ